MLPWLKLGLNAQAWAAQESRLQFSASTVAQPSAAETGREDAREQNSFLSLLAGGPWARTSRQRAAVSGRWVQIAYVLIDVFFICLNAVAVLCIRFLAHLAATLGRRAAETAVVRPPLEQYVAFLLLYAALIPLFCQSQGLYRTPRTRSALDESFSVFKAVLLASLLLASFIYLSGAKEISRLWVGLSGLLNVATLAAWRLWKRRAVERRVAQGFGARNVLIVGAGKIGQALAQHLEQNKQWGYVFKGFLDQNHNGDHRLLGCIEDLPQAARAQFADEVFITIPSEREVVKKVAFEARRHRLNVKVIPELYDGLGWNAPLCYLGEFPVMELHREPIPALGLFVKRALDIVLSAAALIALAPVFVLLALAIKLDSRGAALYRSRRVGKKGRIFVCYKFRTMVQNADALKDRLRDGNERRGPFFKIADDPRVTRLGRFLRKYSLDELPQLFNVLKGDMSLVGPRPHPLDDFERYNLEHLRRLDVKPGITGLWQVTARQDPSFETNMALDLEYIQNWSLGFDLKILVKTIPAVLRAEGN